MLPSERVIGGQRLGHDDVERSAGKVAQIQRRNERILVDGRAAPDIDDISALGKRRHARRVQDIHRVGRGGQGHEEKVRLRQDRVERVDGADLVEIGIRAAAAIQTHELCRVERAHAAGKLQSPSRMISVYSSSRRSSISETITECSAMVVP